MKANYKRKNKLSQAEISKIYDDVELDVASQTIAVVLVTLEINYGWKKDRLTKFINALNATAELAAKTNLFGKEVDTNDLIDHLIEKYGINCRIQAEGM